ncbi:MAG TPA: EamA family transporter [Gaiellaceae bacterium]|nr:EamA family transporter [Gaiellaceae bacterium]
MSRRGFLLFATMCVLWGVPYLFIKVAVEELHPATLVFMRTALAALVLLPIAAARSELRLLLPRWRPLVVFAAIEIGVPWLLLGRAEQHLSSSLTALLIAAVPLVGALLVVAWPGSGERLGRRSILGLLVGFGGVAALVGLDTAGANPLAVAEVGGVAVCYAVGPAILDRFLRGVPGLGVIAVSLGLCAVVYAPIGAVEWPTTTPKAKVIVSVVVLALVCTAVAFLVFFALIAEIGPVRATVFTYVNPAVAALLGVTVLGESFTVGMGVGLVLILIGSVLATRRPASATRGAAVPELEPAAVPVGD